MTEELEIISRKEAKVKGLSFYFTGTPCSRGHVSKRDLNGTCKDCSKATSKEWAKNNRSKINIQEKLRIDKDRSSYNKRQLKYYHCNKTRQDYRKYRKESSSKWKATHRKELTAYENKRRADKLRATPKWANLEVIKEFYKNCPDGYTVDHMIPLKNDLVCGLHVENNLQYLTPSENFRKKNKFVPIIEV